MLETILDLEKKLIRVEVWLLVACVIIMLVLAGYNVAYRNLLVPWQTQLLTSGPPVTTEQASADTEAQEEPASDEEAAAEPSDGEIGGGFGAPSGDSDEAEPEDESNDEIGGGFGAAEEESDDEIGGGFGAAEEESDDEIGGGFGAAEEESDDEIGGGFGAAEEESDDAIGGGFGAAEDGDDDSATETAESDESEEVDASAVAEEAADEAAEPIGGPPPEGSFADTMVGVIDTMKLAWIDILLRQLVIITGFLGAMLAARRRNHITIDAVGKLLEGRPRHIVDAITSFVSVGVCALLAVAGWDLVKIGLEFPAELLPWAEEWTFQLAFPLGFGLLAVHFAIRVYESTVLAMKDETLDDEEGGDAGDAASAEAAAGGAV